MKILFATDGSEHSSAAIELLRRIPFIPARPKDRRDPPWCANRIDNVVPDGYQRTPFRIVAAAQRAVVGRIRIGCGKTAQSDRKRRRQITTGRSQCGRRDPRSNFLERFRPDRRRAQRKECD